MVDEKLRIQKFAWANYTNWIHEEADTLQQSIAGYVQV